MTLLDARMLKPARLSFDPAIPSQVSMQAYQGLRQFGPFDSSRVVLPSKSVLFVFPENLRELARTLAMALLRGHRGFPGFEKCLEYRSLTNRLNNCPLRATSRLLVQLRLAIAK